MTLTPTFGGGVFPLGTHVYREPYQDQDALLSDLPILKRLGFNMIKIQESWAIDEPREGEYDFTRIDRVIVRAEELDLGIYLGLTMEQAPAWLWRRFPDCRLVYASGLAHNDPTQYCLPADGKPGPCWDHPGACAAGERFVAELARRLGRFPNIWAWNTWQEIGFWPNNGGVLGFCYCSYTLARFRQWLEAKYGTLQNLNRIWYTAYGDWEEVEPPRQAPFAPSFIDWRYFMDDVYLPRALEWKTRALKAHDPGGRPVFSHLATPDIGSAAPWRWARVGDFFGNSHYPAWRPSHEWDDVERNATTWHSTALLELWHSMMLRTDFVRCANGRDRALWGAEFQGGPISTHLHLGRVPHPADLQRWMLAGLAAGLHGISFWNHRAERFWSECNGFGLLDPQGMTTERIEEVGRIGRAINREGDLFARSQVPRAAVALLVNEHLHHFCEGTGDNAAALYAYNLRGHYGRLWRLGIAVDFVDAEQVAAGALSAYRVAILPMPLALDDADAEHLRVFVENGGTLISEACPGRFDMYGFCSRSQMFTGAEQLFGARHQHVQIVREPDGSRRWTPQERGWGEFREPTTLQGTGDLGGYQHRASFYLQTLVPTTASPILLTEDAVAGVAHDYGAGRAILLGTFAGLCATAHVDQAADSFWKALLTQAAIQPDLCGRLLRRRRVLDRQEAWFLTNASEEDVVEQIDLGAFTEARDLLVDASGGAYRVQDGVHEVRVPAVGIVCLLVS